MKMRGKTIISLMLALCLLVSAMPLTTLAATDPVKTSNYSENEYLYDQWAQPIRSHLNKNTDGTYTRVEYTGEEVVVETYDANLKFVSGTTLPVELPLYGGFYFGSAANFLVFGQENMEENDSKEVIRVVRYTKDWKRVSAASLTGANITEPFGAATLRFAEYNGYLYIRTGRGMYATSDGSRHQANLTFNVRLSDMKVTCSTNEAVSYQGYSSHSFNQFIGVGNGRLYGVDHGDAYPRSVVLYRYNAAAGQDSFLERKWLASMGYTGYVEQVDVLPIMGGIGDNQTGVGLGGFEITNTHCLIAGNTVPQDSTYDPANQRNIFVAATSVSDFTSGGTTIRYLTNYTSADDVEISVPHFVKVDASRYVVLWAEDSTNLCWAVVNASGVLQGQVNKATGRLSDCKPIVSGNKLMWYVTKNSVPSFHTIDLSKSNTVDHNHVYRYSYASRPTETTAGELTATCIICSQTGTPVTMPAVAGSDEYYLYEVTKEATCLASGYASYKWSKAEAYGVYSYSYRVTIPAKGHSYESTVTKEATCGNTGIQLNTCTRCGKSESISIPALGHSYETVKVDATCMQDGSITDTCSRCGDVKTETLPATGHSYETVTVDATCTQDGSITRTCTGCGDVQIEILPAPGHDYVTEDHPATCTAPGRIITTCKNCGDTTIQEYGDVLDHDYEIEDHPPTCTEPGYKTYTCRNCGYTSNGHYAGANGHSYETVRVEPTCTQEGSVTQTCTVCGDVQTTVLPAVSHDYLPAVDHPATCTTPGYTSRTCRICGYESNSTYAGPLGHDKYSVVTPPTCTEEGYTRYYCTRCNYGETREPVKATGHTYVLTTIPPTCTEAGMDCKMCHCGDYILINEHPAMGHSPASVVKTDPTCTTEGYMTFTCRRCSADYIDNVVPPLGHAYTAYEVLPDCENDGFTRYVCSICYAQYIDDEVPALGHCYEDGKCTSCGAEDPDYILPSKCPTIALKYPTLTFEDVVVMNVYFAASDLEDVVEMGLITYTGYVDQGDLETADAVIPGYTWSEGDNLYYASTQGIAAKDLGDEIYFAVYAKLADGTCTYSRLVSYSPKTYAYTSLTSGAAAMKPVVVAMLNYGAAAQTFFHYKTDDLINSSLTDDQNSLIEAYNSSMMEPVVKASGEKVGLFESSGGFSRCYPTVSFEGAFSINYYFIPSHVPDGGVKLFYWTQADYNAASILNSENASGWIIMENDGTGVYHAVVDGIAAKDLDQTLYVAGGYMCDGVSYCTGVLAYSIGTYCTTQAAGTGTTADLAKATAVYGYHAKKLFNQ